MLKKTLMVATLGTALAAGTLSTAASAQGDPFLGALVGGGIGAAIGHSVNGHNGAWVGGAVGALAGASIAANSGYYGGILRAVGVCRAGARVLRLRHPITARRRSTSRAAGGVSAAPGRLRAPVLRAALLRPRWATVTVRLRSPDTRTRTRDTDHSSSSSRARRPRHPAGLFFCAGPPAAGKQTRTRAPLLSSRATDFEYSCVAVDDFLDDGETQAGSIAVRPGNPVEALDNLRPLGSGDARPRVLDAQVRRAIAHAGAHRRRAAGRRVPQSVVDQVVEQLRE